MLQTQLFYDQQQGARETVDEYAQALKKSFTKAYPRSSRGGPEAEVMGQTVLANQFVSGLCSELKSKVVGIDGGLEQLLLKARFEEAKRKEFASAKPPTYPKKSTGGPNSSPAPKSLPKGILPSSDSPKPEKGNRNCYNCGLAGHLVRVCPYPRRPKGELEARGRKESAVANVRSSNEPIKQKIEKLRQELREAEMAGIITGTTATMHLVTSSVQARKSRLGLTVVAEVKVNGTPTEALIDTG